MLIGNKDYLGSRDVPRVVPIFPLNEALLLPRAQLPLNIFETRYLAMVDAALAGNRVIGMLQPSIGAPSPVPDLCAVGCVGRLTALQEAGDGRYLITLTGISRFRLVEEQTTTTPFRQAVVDTAEFADDFIPEHGADSVDRTDLLRALKCYLKANNLEADWDGIERASTEALVNALSMMSPYSAAEKQALLEAPNLKTRAETLVAITDMDLASRSGTSSRKLQ